MKKTALALAALVALSGAALAGETAKNDAGAAPAACVATTVRANLDCAATGSIDKAGSAAGDTATGGKKLGIDLNPWSVTNGF